MSFIQVPLGEGISKFPKLRFSKPEPKLTSLPSQISDLEFLQNLAERNRLIERTEDRDSIGSIIEHIPETGSTFYFLGAVIQNIHDSNTVDVSIVNDNITRERVTLAVNEIHKFELPIDRLVGDGMKSYTVELLDDNPGEARVSFYGWEERTIRIP